LEPTVSRKTKASDALKKIEDSPWIFLEISKVFWKEKKYEKTRKFLK
jgi:pre-mRNA-processing factor 6